MENQFSDPHIQSNRFVPPEFPMSNKEIKRQIDARKKQAMSSKDYDIYIDVKYGGKKPPYDV